MPNRLPAASSTSGPDGCTSFEKSKLNSVVTVAMKISLGDVIPRRNGAGNSHKKDGENATARRIQQNPRAVPHSHIQIRHVQRVLLDELAPWFNHVAHQLDEDVVGVVHLADLHLQQRARLAVERRLPELVLVHLAEAFIALHADAL